MELLGKILNHGPAHELNPYKKLNHKNCTKNEN